MRETETELMLKGYGLTTAELYYRMPDYKNVLNSFIWQDYDLAPDHPRLFQFIEFWQEKIEGPLHSVRFTHRKLIAPGEWRNVPSGRPAVPRGAWASTFPRQPRPSRRDSRRPHASGGRCRRSAG